MLSGSLSYQLVKFCVQGRVKGFLLVFLLKRNTLHVYGFQFLDSCYFVLEIKFW